MHFKPIIASLLPGTCIVTMIFARALALLPLPLGCLTLRQWPSGSQ